jgi:hypothetical protein
VALALPARPARAACADDPLVRDFQDSGDAFRAVTVLRQHEVEQRGTPAGFECSRMILGAYLRHGELDLVDDWVGRMGRDYAPLLGPGRQLRLNVEVAFLLGNSAEVARRARQSGQPGLDGLVAISAAADRPMSFDLREAPGCFDAACASLRRLLDGREARPHKSPGLALALGIVPGLGQVYAGRPLAGLGSFLLNGFLISTTAFGVSRHEYALAVFSGAAAVAFYGGSIYAGYEAATRFNEHQADELRGEIRALPVDLEINKLAL